VVRLDGSWHFNFVSKGIENLFEVTQEDACRDADIMTRCIIDEDRPSFHESVDYAVQKLLPWNHEHRIRTSSGALKWIRGMALPRRLPDGSTLWNGILSDITERKQAEDDIRRDKALLRCLIDSVGDLIFIKDMNGVYQACNKASEEFIGLPECEQIGKTDFDFFDRDVAEVIRKCDMQIMDSGKEGRFEEWVTYRDGRRILLDTVKAPFYDPDGNQLGLVGISRDITERKRAEEALRRSEQQLAEAQKLAHIGSWEWDPITNEITGSDEFSRMFGMVSFSYDSFLEMVHPDDRETVKNAVRETLAHQSPYNVHYRLIRPDGITRIIHAQGAGIIDGAGKIVRGLGTAQDVTERKEMEEKLEMLYSELAAHAVKLEAANRELEAFNATVSHDLRTPLVRINRICQLFLNLYGDRLDEVGHEYLRGICSSTLQMSNLINTFLEFSRLSHCALVRQTVNLSSMATEIAAELKIGSPERQVQFRITEGIITEGDPELLRIALVNILGNAWKYSARKENAVIEFGITEYKEKQAFFVRDNGVGFDMTKSGRLFAPFQRLKNQEELTGHGIGLSTVHRIISRHGGRIWAESEPGKGATFYFSL